MYFRRFYDEDLAQASYLVGCQATGSALVVDPARSIDAYLEVAQDEGLQIELVTETHIHADFLSGSQELVAQTGARLLLSDEGGTDWSYLVEHDGLRDGDRFEVGNLVVEVVHTPGHTPEHISLVLYDPPAGPEPRMIFTGDFLFVGDVGRPDLLDEAAGMVGTREVGARDLFASLRRLDELADHVLVWPGHGAGSACGKSLGAVPVSTLGFERVTNWALMERDEARFVERLLEGQPEAPYYFAQMKRLNRGRDRSTLWATPTSIDVIAPAEAAGRLASGDLQVVDLRESVEFFAGHLPGSLNVPPSRGRATWYGWILDYERPIALVADSAQAHAAARELASIGLDRVIGRIDPELPVVGAIPSATVVSVSASDALQLMRRGASVLDVRSAAEFEEGHLDGAVNVHTGRIPRQRESIPASGELLVHCQSGYRSAIACSLLSAAGRVNMINVEGGYDAIEAARAAQVAATRA